MLLPILGLFSDSRNNFELQDLTESADGIFKVSPTNTYYYEKSHDRLVLPLYVKSSQAPNIQYGTIASTLLTPDSRTIKTLFNITLVDCNSHTSCISCASMPQCSWCGHKCLNPNTHDQKQPSQCTTEANSCESFDTGTNKLLIPYTAHRQQAPLIFTLLNSNSSTESMQCVFTMFNGKFVGKNITLPFGMLNKTHGHCSLSNVFEDLSVFIDDASSNSSMGQIQTNLRLYNAQTDSFVDSISQGKLALLFYKCEIKANDCGQCLSLNRQYSCMWCNINPIVVMANKL